jgi:GPH family glycoside/pentoside/hexuronide:cation symporter
MSSTERLPMRTKLAFGVGASAEAAVWIAFNTWTFLFYNNVLGLSGTLCGLALTLSLVLDAIADPVVGFLSDRWHSKLGRRHPFLYAAPLPLAASFYLLYVPPSSLQGVPLFFWLTLFSVLFRQALTLYQVPHLALGAELSTDYRERSVVMSYNSIFTVIGGASTYIFGWTRFSHTVGGTTVRTAYPGLGLAVGTFAAVTVLVSAYFTRDQIPRLVQAPAGQPRFTLRQMLTATWASLSNRNYVMLLLGLLCLSATTGTRETLGSYVSLFYWALPEDKIRVFGLASPPAFVIAFILTARLHARFSKRAAIMVSTVGLVLAACTPVLARIAGLMPANGAPGLIRVLFVFVFLFYLAVAVMQISVLSALADVADEYELQTGLRQEGVFYAARTFFAKMTSALGTVLAGFAIDFIHFPHGAKPGHVAGEVLFKLGLIDGPISSVPALLAVFFYARYRIDKQRHAEIQRELEQRRTSVAPASPSLHPAPAARAPEPAAG